MNFLGTVFSTEVPLFIVVVIVLSRVLLMDYDF